MLFNKDFYTQNSFLKQKIMLSKQGTNTNIIHNKKYKKYVFFSNYRQVLNHIEFH